MKTMIPDISNIFKRSAKQGRVVLPDASESIVVDVRTPQEFEAGHYKGSLNIPLHIIESHIKDFRDSGKKLVLVCRSGARSGRATEILRAQGIEAYNGGPWDTFEFHASAE
jgi:phage shock protein E